MRFHSHFESTMHAAPTIVFIHGALNDRGVWSAQAGPLAERGHAVLAVDLPGHGASPGPALTSVEAMADWLLASLDAAGIARALLVGHSMGSLVALEAAFRDPARVTGMALLGTASPMKVSDALLAGALEDQDAAIGMVAHWSSSAPELEQPAREAMRRVAEAGPPALLHTDLSACKAYANGGAAAAAVACPTLFILGSQDKMTPPRAAKTLTESIRHGRIVEVDAGHAMMAEQPKAVLDALAAFATACAA